MNNASGITTALITQGEAEGININKRTRRADERMIFLQSEKAFIWAIDVFS